MLVRTYGLLPQGAPIIGAVGEVREFKSSYNNITMDYTVVYFPNHVNMNRSDGVWGIATDVLIPINDPDADITEHTEKPVEDLV